MATSHFYHDSYFRRFRLVYKLKTAVGDFWFVVCNIEVAEAATPAQDNFKKSLQVISLQLTYHIRF